MITLEQLVSEQRAGYFAIGLKQITSLDHRQIGNIFDNYHILETWKREEWDFVLCYAYSEHFDKLKPYHIPGYYSVLILSGEKLNIEKLYVYDKCEEIEHLISSEAFCQNIDLRVFPQDRAQMAVGMFLDACQIFIPGEPTPIVNYELLKSLVREECQEFVDAMDDLEEWFVYGNSSSDSLHDDMMDAWTEVIDAMCDIIVVVHNTSNAMGIDLKPFLDEVLRSNLTKIGGPRREDGKVLKPETFSPPKIKEMLADYLDKYHVCLGGQRNKL